MTAGEAMARTATYLSPHRDALVSAWSRALSRLTPAPDGEIHAYCASTVDRILERLSRGETEEFLRDEALAAAEAVRAGTSLLPLAKAIRVLDRCCLPFLLSACPDRDTLVESLLALDELGDERLEILLAAQEEEAHRRLGDVQDQAAVRADHLRELSRANEELRRSRDQSEHRAEQIALVNAVAHRIAPILDPEELMQEAARAIQARMNHSYVAVVVLDHEGVLVGRWAGRPGVGRRGSGRAQGPAGGVIGRALRKAAPQVVDDVSSDPDYHPDVPGSASEMVIPLLDSGAVLGAIDFQSEKRAAFDLDGVAAGEILAEFLVVALRNARLFSARSLP